MIYVVVAHAIKAMKIGISTNPHRRIRSLQTAVPTPLEIVAVIPSGGREDECRFHGELREFHMHGEWYTLSIAAMNRTARLLHEYRDALNGPEYQAVREGKASPLSRHPALMVAPRLRLIQPR